MSDALQNTKNYFKQAGAGTDNQLVLGGTVNVESTAVVQAAGTQAGPTSALTDSTGGTPSATLAAITAGAGYAQADMVAVKNALASLAAQYNALLTILKNLGMTS